MAVSKSTTLSELFSLLDAMGVSHFELFNNPSGVRVNLKRGTRSFSEGGFPDIYEAINAFLDTENSN